VIKTFQILIIFLLGQILCYSQDVVSFEAENITFKIQDNIFIVEGLYYFNSELEKHYAILYPFPSDSIYGNPFNVNVVYINTGEKINYKVNKDSSLIIFPALIKGKTPLMISYKQQLKSYKAKYILMSTSYWNKPLGQVDYKLITELDFRIIKFSIPPDKEITLENKKIYLWQKKNFKPTIDFEIEYEK
jgi:hypothetical protein